MQSARLLLDTSAGVHVKVNISQVTNASTSHAPRQRINSSRVGLPIILDVASTSNTYNGRT